MAARLWEARAYGEAPRRNCGWRLDRDWPALDGDARAEVAVIGAGYAGLSAALSLAEAGIGVTVLEAEAPGWGASGRNGGFCCLGGAGLGDGAIARRFGRAAADAWVATELAAIETVAGRLARHAIEAQEHSDGELVLAHRPREARGFEAARGFYARHGIEAEVLGPGALAERGARAEGIHGGLHVRAGFALDPGAYAAGLARAARAAGVVIHGGSEVTALTRAGAGFRLATARGSVTADKVLIATNAYSREDLPGWGRGRFLPVPSSILMSRVITPEEQAAQGWSSDLMAYDTRRLLHYFRLLPDGRFLFGMRGGRRATARAEARNAAAMRADFEAMFPAWREVETPQHWWGLVNLTRGLTPYVGPVPGLDGAFVTLAFHGNGVAMASHAGALVAGLIRGDGTRVPEVLARVPGRFPLGRFRRAWLDAETVGSFVTDRF